MLKNWRVWIGVTVIVLAILACGTPASLMDIKIDVSSSADYVWMQSYNMQLPAWRYALTFVPVLSFLAFFVGSAIVAFFTTLNSGNKARLFAFAAALLFAFMWARASYTNVEKQALTEVRATADYERETGIPNTQKNIATQYAEQLNFLATDYKPNQYTNYQNDGIDVKVCHYGYDSESNCAPYEKVYPVDSYEVCTSHDDDGNCTSTTTLYHYLHNPDVAYMVRYAVITDLPDKYAGGPLTGLTVDPRSVDQPLLYFSDWMLPEDYKQHPYENPDAWRWLWTIDNQVKDQDPAKYTPPAIWTHYKEKIDQFGFEGITTWNKYSNPLLAVANAEYANDPVLEPRLEAMGLFPEPRDLYCPLGDCKATYFDYVYYLGSLNNDPTIDRNGFTTDARAINMVIGNTKHISTSFMFVSTNDLNDIGISVDQLLFSIKANMYNQDKWKMHFAQIDQTLFTIMQQNMILVLCEVSDGANGKFIPPTGCRVMSGLPIGNEALSVAIKSGLPIEMANVAFTPEGFFGNPKIERGNDGKLFISGTDGHPIKLWDTYGVKKPSMEDNFGKLINNIKLSEQDINNLIQDAIQRSQSAAGAMYFWPCLLLILEFVLIVTMVVVTNN